MNEANNGGCGGFVARAWIACIWIELCSDTLWTIRLPVLRPVSPHSEKRGSADVKRAGRHQCGTSSVQSLAWEGDSLAVGLADGSVTVYTAKVQVGRLLLLRLRCSYMSVFLRFPFFT